MSKIQYNPFSGGYHLVERKAEDIITKSGDTVEVAINKILATFNSEGLFNNFSFEKITTYLLVKKYQQMILHGGIEIDGELDLKGTLILNR